jgi:hypothetical protein
VSIVIVKIIVIDINIDIIIIIIIICKLITMASSTRPRGLNGQKIGKLCRAPARLSVVAQYCESQMYISSQACAAVRSMVRQCHDSDTRRPQFPCPAPTLRARCSCVLKAKICKICTINPLRRVMADAATSTQQQLQAWSQHSCCCCGGGCRTGLVADNPKTP